MPNTSEINTDVKMTGTDAPDVPATTFPRFGKLPVELMIKICRMMEPESRVIGLYKEFETKPHDRLFWIHNALAPPITLAICSAFRAETLKRYEPFGNKGTMYINLEKDVVYVTDRSPKSATRSHYATARDMTKIKTITISEDGGILGAVANWVAPGSFSGPKTNHLPNLKEVRVLNLTELPDMTQLEKCTIVKGTPHREATKILRQTWDLYVSKGCQNVKIGWNKVIGPTVNLNDLCERDENGRIVENEVFDYDEQDETAEADDIFLWIDQPLADGTVFRARIKAGKKKPGY